MCSDRLKAAYRYGLKYYENNKGLKLEDQNYRNCLQTESLQDLLS